MGNMVTRTAFVGLGNIGGPMARRMAGAFPGSHVYDVHRPTAERLADVASVATDLAELGRAAETVAVCVRDDDDVLSVMDGLLSTMREGTIIIHSTVRPSTVRRAAEDARRHGVDVIDAAVSGGADGAARGQLTAMVGGTDAAVRRITPVLESYCSDIIHAGDLGTGMALKLCNNLVTYAELSAALDAYRLAAALGLDPAQLTAVMTNNGNLTPSMRQYVGFRETGAAAIGHDAFRASQEALASLGEKDLSLALEAAKEAGSHAEMTGFVRESFRRTVMKGLDDD